MARKKTKKRENTRLLKSVKKDEKKLLKIAKKLEKDEKRIVKEEKNIEKLERKIVKDEKAILLAIGKLKIKKEHLFDFIKIVAGSLLGASLGKKFIDSELAVELPWLNVIGILLLIFAISYLLVYKAERKTLAHKRHKQIYILTRILYIWIVATMVGSLSALLFMTEYPGKEIFIKSLLINLYPAVAGAIGFSLI